MIAAMLEERKNELYRAMGIVEELGGTSPKQTAVIVKLGERLQELKNLSGNSNVGGVMARSAAPLKYPGAEDCPDVKRHTDGPDGYVAWFDWAAKKSKTHAQEQCPTCGFFAVWVNRGRETV